MFLSFKVLATKDKDKDEAKTEEVLYIREDSLYPIGLLWVTADNRFAGWPVDGGVGVPLAVPALQLGRTDQVVTLQRLYR